VFVLVSAVGSSLLATSRAHAEEAHKGRARAEALLQLNRVMIDQPDPRSALQALCRQLQAAFGLLGVAVLVRQADGWQVIASSDASAAARPLTPEESLLAERAAERGPFVQDGALAALPPRKLRRIVAHPTPTRTSMQPLFMSDALLGALRLDAEVTAAEPEPQLLNAFAGEAALALHRLELARSAGQAEALRQADEVKTALLSSISHDLKTPLATIKTSISSLLDESVTWSPPNRRSFLESIGDETDRLDKTISALLDLNRLESGAVRPILRTEALAQLVEAAIEQASGALRARSVRVDVAPISVRTDGSLIRHAVANLLENAALYSRPEGQVRVRACVTNADVEVTVEDDGPGIDREDLPFVFHRFYRARGAHAVSGGSGLGLAIVKGFVTACGGSVEVESSRARTRFTIRLPRSEAALA
jgi:two-component system sensor histidine kinase KdpD